MSQAGGRTTVTETAQNGTGARQPSVAMLQRLRASASLESQDREAGLQRILKQPTPPAIRAAAAVLVEQWRRRDSRAGVADVRLAAIALGAGYATGRAMLGDVPVIRMAAPPEGARQLRDRIRQWDQTAIFRAAGATATDSRRQLDVLLADAPGSRAIAPSTRDEMFMAGLSLAVAEAEAGS